MIPLGSIVCLTALSLAAQLIPQLEHKISDAAAGALKESGAPSVSIAVVEHGKLAYAKAFGAANPSTRYAAGSISKQFTAAALLLLQEQGKLSLDNKVSQYFPTLTRAGEISIRQLLTHTSGYEDYAPQDYLIPEWLKRISPREILGRWAAKPLNFDPGTRWQYSNTNYVLAGEIFEKVSGRPLVPYLREKIFDPLGMQSAGDCSATGPADATAYTRFAVGLPRSVKREAAVWYSAAGELCMTASDLARWDEAFLARKILSPQSYQEFTTEAKLSSGDLTHYALGLQVGDLSGIPMISHGGEVSGFLALNSIFPTRAGAIVALSNEDGVSFLSPLTRQIATLIFLPDQPPESEKDTQQVRSILEGLRNGRIDRALFTGNANFYFTAAALPDFRKSLSTLGKLKSVSRSSESLRGGMTHRTYRAQFENKTVLLNIFVVPGGKYEQFMVMEQL